MTGGRRRGAAFGTAALAAGLVATAFAGKGGTNLSELVTTEIWLTLAAGAALVGAVLFGSPQRLQGVGVVAAFAALTAFTALSVLWSLAPDESWVEANRTLTYLLVFTAAVACGNLLPGLLRPLLGGLTIAAVAIVGYGLASRVWPGTLAEVEFYARLGQPFGYWNAVGVVAAMALVGVLWFGSRRELAPRVAALASPGAALAMIALLLTYSRSGLVAGALAVGLWLLFVPLRLRTLAVIAAAGLSSVPTVAWALSQDAFTEDGVELATREDAGTPFGLLLLLTLGLAYGICLAAFRWRERNQLPPGRRRTAGRTAAAAAGCVVLVAFGGMAATERGISGTLSDRFEELTDDSASTTGGPGRLGTTASSRSRYWRAAGDVFEDHPVKGAGAGAFAVTGLRYRTSAHVARHAHGYVVQTLADLGLIGLGLSLILLVSWFFAALRATGATPRSTIGQRFLLGEHRVDSSRAPTWTDERIAVIALALAAVAYGLQSGADWTWFVPAPTVMALVAAGYVAGRRAPRAPSDPPAPQVRAAVTNRRLGAAGLIVLATLACAWNAWQPQRADDLANDALALAAAGEIEGALAKASDARDVNPLSPKPLWAEAAAHVAAARLDDAHAAFEEAVAEHPNLAQAWLRLADFRLDRLNDPEAALEAIEPAIYLDPYSYAVQQGFIDIRDRFRAAGQLPPETAPPLLEEAP